MNDMVTLKISHMFNSIFDFDCHLKTEKVKEI